jgi:hypothetical protein
MKKALALIIIIFLTGCSAFRPYNQPVKFNCQPEGVTLVINGQKKECPCTVEMRRNREISIEGYKDGYASYKRTVSYHSSTTGILDLIGTFIFLLPVFGLMTPGSDDLDETDITVILVKNALIIENSESKNIEKTKEETPTPETPEETVSNKPAHTE